MWGQVTKYNHALRADSTKYFLPGLAVRRASGGAPHNAPPDTDAESFSFLNTKKHFAHAKCFFVFASVSTTGVEPARANAHYPLKVARLPIPPRGHVYTL